MITLFFFSIFAFTVSLVAEEQAPPPIVDNSFYGIIHEFSGNVRTKKAESFNWVDANKDQKIQIGDFIFVDEDAQLTLRIPFTKKELKIPKGTIIRFSQNLPKRSPLQRIFRDENKSDKLLKAQQAAILDLDKKSNDFQSVSYEPEKPTASNDKKSEEEKKKEPEKKEPKYNQGNLGIAIKTPKDKFKFLNPNIDKNPEEISFSWTLNDTVLSKYFDGKEVDADYQISIWEKGQPNPFCCDQNVSDNGQGEAYHVVKLHKVGTYYFQVSTVLQGGENINSQPQVFHIEQKESKLENVDLNNLDGGTIIIQ